MPKFYFNIERATETILDLEGTDLTDLDEARAEALQDARDLMSSAIRRGEDISTCYIVICDDQEEILLRVSFTEAYGKFD